MDVPALVERAPADVHGPDVTIDANHVENVGVATGEKNTTLTTRLILHQFPDVSESRDLAPYPKFSSDQGVDRRPDQGVNGQSGGLDTLLNLAEEILLEVIADEANLDDGRLRNVDPEAVCGHEAGDGRKGDGGDTTEKLIGFLQPELKLLKSRRTILSVELIH